MLRVKFFQRDYPSSNMILLQGKRPVLVDPGFGSDFSITEKILKSSDISLTDIELIVNTHYHSDHVGSNGLIQEKYGTPIAAHWWEASIINRRDREACCAEWLRQPVVPYQVATSFTDGYEIDTGDGVVKVLETPGHTVGHISLYVEKSMELISGDFLLESDVGWINIFREGTDAIEHALKSLERISRLPLKKVYPGHGPVLYSPEVQIENARRKYEQWLKHPEKLAWHACKRIFAFGLMINNGLPEKEVETILTPMRLVS